MGGRVKTKKKKKIGSNIKKYKYMSYNFKQSLCQNSIYIYIYMMRGREMRV
jgi:hypothetical protein